jgi:hypothetical protein
VIDHRYNSLAACSQFDDELAAHLEGEARPFVVSHSQDCVRCGAVLADLQTIRAAAKTLPQEAPSPSVWMNLRAKLEAERAFEVVACAQFKAELDAHLEGETRPFVLAHSKDCASCSALLADLQSIQVAAKTLPQETPSPALWANLRAKLEAEGAFALPACAQFEGDLQAYLDGEARPFVLTHAKDCGSCGALLADMEAIRMAARELPLGEPSRVVWANLRAQLESEGAFGMPVSSWNRILSWRWMPHLVPLGTLAGLIFLGAVLTIPSLSGHSWEAATQWADSAPVAKLALVNAGEDGSLARVVSDLEKSFRASEASMTPDLKATYDESLVTLDGSIHECLDSLQQEPGNTLAHDYLLTAYTRKAEVLSSALESEGR